MRVYFLGILTIANVMAEINIFFSSARVRYKFSYHFCSESLMDRDDDRVKDMA